ncbi:MAG: LPP20 family lipoprotein [Deltaproteobacteria bacterium]|nr:LPP20 family lipoprotein [Deltaproteobacteria bacterium]
MRKRYFMAALMVVFLMVVAAGNNLSAQMGGTGQYIEQVGQSGAVNWTAGYIEAIGIGAPPERFAGKPQARPMAIRAAQVDAYRKLLEVTKGVRVDAETLVKDFTVESDIIRTTVEGLIKGAQVIKTDYLSDGTVEVTLRMSLTGGFAQVIYPAVVERAPAQRPLSLAPTQPSMAPSSPTFPAAPTAQAPSAPQAVGVVTGLVIDARGLTARPAMAPKVLDENGQEVYGSMQVDREYAVQQGMSGYARDLSAAQSNQRVTNNPLTVKGLKADGPGKSNIVVSNPDAAKLRSASDTQTFMRQCRVMIVLD